MYNYSTPYENIQGSFIRNILQLANKKEFISFAGGLPNNQLFPKKQLKFVFEKYSYDIPQDIFQYAPTAGLDKLIQTIKEQFHLKQNLLICNGIQQGLDLISAVFINPHDKVLVEEPTYLGATGLFKSYGAQCESVRVLKNGVNLKELELKLQRNQYKFFYVIPNFQNPSSISYSIKKREALARLAIKYNLIIIEDDPYAYLHFKNKLKPKIYDFAKDNTIYLGSFSKILIPALRLGYIMANEELLSKINIAKQYKDLHTNMFSQYILHAYLNEFDIFKHIKKIQIDYEKKLRFFDAYLKKELGKVLKINRPKGGMFVWAKIKDNRDSEILLHKAIENKVLYVPGIMFCENKSNKSYIRFNFTNSNKKQMIEGIKRLKNVFS